MKDLNGSLQKARSLKEQMNERRVRMMLEPLLTTADLQELFKVERRTIDRLVKRGVIPKPLKLGGNRWRVEDMAHVIENQAEERNSVPKQEQELVME
jgi:predicted DNA-binding transcriptional regulator AlpA